MPTSPDTARSTSMLSKARPAAPPSSAGRSRSGDSSVSGTGSGGPGSLRHPSSNARYTSQLVITTARSAIPRRCSTPCPLCPCREPCPERHPVRDDPVARRARVGCLERRVNVPDALRQIRLRLPAVQNRHLVIAAQPACAPRVNRQIPYRREQEPSPRQVSRGDSCSKMQMRPRQVRADGLERGVPGGRLPESTATTSPRPASTSVEVNASDRMLPAHEPIPDTNRTMKARHHLEVRLNR